MNLIKKTKIFDKIITNFKGHICPNINYYDSSHFTLLCFNIKAYAITENQYLVIKN